MQLRKIAGEHTIDVDLLPEAPLVLDVGCRDFLFCKEILELRPKGRIVAFEPDPATVPPDDERIQFFKRALTHRGESTVTWQGEGDGSYIAGAEYSYGWGVNDPTKAAQVPNTKFDDLIAYLQWDCFDLVKLDCEGSEFGILENWPGPVAKQISVEFHDFINRRKWDDNYFARLFDGPLGAYRIIQHPLIPIGPAKSLGHWDTVLALK
jgi:FkbM family methyltransferase